MTTRRRALTPKQNEIYDYIRDSIQTNGAAPTIQEIATHFSIRSTNAVFSVLTALEKKGYIKRVPRTARGIVLTEHGGLNQAQSKTTIPLLRQGYSAQSEVENDGETGEITIDPELIRTDDAFATIVPDNAMAKEGVYKDDYVIVHRQSHVPDGSLIVASRDSQHIVRRFRELNATSCLLPADTSFKQITITPNDNETEILGKVVAVLRVLPSS